MPHFSADLLDALLDGDPAELEALRAILGREPAAPVADEPAIPVRPARPGRCAACRPAPWLRPAPSPEGPAKPERRGLRRDPGDGQAARPAPGARNTGRRPGLPAARVPGGARGRPARHRSGP